MDSKEFSCFCGTKVSYSKEQNMQQHIRNCKNYHNESPFFKEFNKLPIEKLKEVHLVAIKSEFSVYLELIQQELIKKGYQQDQLPQNGISQVKNNSNNFILNDEEPTINLMKKSSLIKPAPFDPTVYQQFGESIKAVCCQRDFSSIFDIDKIWYLSNCVEPYCKECFTRQVNKDYINNNGQLLCKSCSLQFEQYDYESIIGKTKYEELQNLLIKKMYNIINCVKCKQEFEFQVGRLGQNVRDANGNKLTKEMEIHYVENRYICGNNSCKTEQCKSCGATPYHMGYNCDSFKNFKQSKRCRYCDTAIAVININQPIALQDICDAEECKKKIKFACPKILQCSHSCSGFSGELACLPCLKDECVQKLNDPTLGQNSDDYCNICFVEGLGAAPCIRSICGHVFHLHCVQKRLEIKWPSARINFNFCFCPLCKQWMEFPKESPLQTMMTNFQNLLEDIKKKSMERLKFEERLKDEKLIKQDSHYYNKPTEYALAIYSYYMCFKCQKPYFGGLKDCIRGMEEEKREFDPKELVCPNCCDIPIDNCQKHGGDFIEFKCRFCCSVAQWYCWGTTHFCEPCHKRQCNGDYVSKYTKDKLPKCKGKDTCPLKIDHKENGEECSLGCSLCRNMKENARNF